MGFLGFLFAVLGGAPVVLAFVFAQRGEFTKATGSLVVGMNMIVSGATLVYVSMIHDELRQRRESNERDRDPGRGA